MSLCEHCSGEHARENDARWLAAQRAAALSYLREQEIDHGGVAEQPAWQVAPHLAVWPVASPAARGQTAWWVITGDAPTDYLSIQEAADPRAALRHFAGEWAEIADYMLRGEEHPDAVIGTPESWPELGLLLGSRARLLREWAEDESLWGV